MLPWLVLSATSYHLSYTTTYRARPAAPREEEDTTSSLSKHIRSISSFVPNGRSRDKAAVRYERFVDARTLEGVSLGVVWLRVERWINNASTSKTRVAADDD